MSKERRSVGEYPANIFVPRDLGNNAQDPIITMVNPKNRDQAWKLCKCNECGKVAVCTPAEDFFVEEADKDKESAPLYCWTCLIKRANAKNPDKPPLPITEEPLYEKRKKS
jgi:hypothetical protein